MYSARRRRPPDPRHGCRRAGRLYPLRARHDAEYWDLYWFATDPRWQRRGTAAAPCRAMDGIAAAAVWRVQWRPAALKPCGRRSFRCTTTPRSAASRLLLQARPGRSHHQRSSSSSGCYFHVRREHPIETRSPCRPLATLPRPGSARHREKLAGAPRTADGERATNKRPRPAGRLRGTCTRMRAMIAAPRPRTLVRRVRAEHLPGHRLQCPGAIRWPQPSGGNRPHVWAKPTNV